MSLDLEAIKARHAATTPGHWWAAIDGDGDYWDLTGVYAFDTDEEPPTYHRGEPDSEAASEACSAWADAHEMGKVAETHDYLPIPDDQHDANQRFIAAAHQDIPALVAEVERLRAGGSHADPG